MDPKTLLTGLSKYLADRPADELLQRVNWYMKATLQDLPRVVFRERHEDAYPDEFFVIKLGPIDSGEVRIEYRGYFTELKKS